MRGLFFPKFKQQYIGYRIGSKALKGTYKMDDSEIVELYWARDEAAIAETDKKYGAYCHKIAMNILSNLQDAEECVNSTFLNAWNAIPPHRPTMLSTFLGKITRNLSLQYIRKKNAARRGGGECVVAFEELCECIPAPEDCSVYAEIDAERLGELINDYLKTVSKDARMLFIGKYYYFDHISDIAKRLGMKESRAKTLLYRTRDGLKVYLKREGVDVE